MAETKRKGMSYSDAGRLGALRTYTLWIEKYNENPKKCKPCKKRKNVFCNHSCAALYNNRGRKRYAEGKSY